jgi:hypothetical protein
MIDKWNEFVPVPNDYVAWAWSAGGTDRQDLVRVATCEEQEPGKQRWRGRQ